MSFGDFIAVFSGLGREVTMSVAPVAFLIVALAAACASLFMLFRSFGASSAAVPVVAAVFGGINLIVFALAMSAYLVTSGTVAASQLAELGPHIVYFVPGGLSMILAICGLIFAVYESVRQKWRAADQPRSILSTPLTNIKTPSRAYIGNGTYMSALPAVLDPKTGGDWTVRARYDGMSSILLTLPTTSPYDDQRSPRPLYRSRLAQIPLRTIDRPDLVTA